MICIYSLVLILYSVCEEHEWVEQQCIAVSSRHPAEDITVEKLEVEGTRGYEEGVEGVGVEGTPKAMEETRLLPWGGV